MRYDFGNTLRGILANRGITQTELCRLTGIRSSTMSEYLSNKSTPSVSKAVAIADALGISLDELCGRNVPNSAAQREMMRNMSLLNEEGQENAIRTVAGMTYLPEYKKSYRPIMGSEEMAG